MGPFHLVVDAVPAMRMDIRVDRHLQRGVTLNKVCNGRDSVVSGSHRVLVSHHGCTEEESDPGGLSMQEPAWFFFQKCEGGYDMRILTSTEQEIVCGAVLPGECSIGTLGGATAAGGLAGGLAGLIGGPLGGLGGLVAGAGIGAVGAAIGCAVALS